MNFATELQNTLNSDFNETLTENGAVAFSTTGKKLLDMEFALSSLRSASKTDIEDQFVNVFYEDKLLAIKWLFRAGDVREGHGERRLFKIGFTYLASNHPELAKELLKLVPEYTRWDNLWPLLDTPLKNAVIELVMTQLSEDLKNMAGGKPVSLLAKWMPSANTSSPETKARAKQICKAMGGNAQHYRQILSALRRHIDVVEVKMSAKKWDEIDYSAVPSKANLLYRNAFLAHDEDRRRKFLEDLSSPDSNVKINAGTLYPHEIVTKYRSCCWRNFREGSVDDTLEALWSALPDKIDPTNRTICVADGSGSMMSSLPQSEATALDVANALAIYFAEHSAGEFRDKYITFSSKPQLVDLSNGKNLKEKLQIASNHNEVANTDIEAVFDLILLTAVKNGMSQDDVPQNILVLSDMEFDDCVTVGPYGRRGMFDDCVTVGRRGMESPTPKLFEVITQKYRAAGYKIPRVIFWNICSRTGAIPMMENELGVALVSGFSTNTFEMVMSSKTDPVECLLEQINSPRYLPVEDKIQGLL